MSSQAHEASGDSRSFTGGCACGAVRYDIEDAASGMGDCQCRQCQQRSGTGHGSYIAFASRDKVKLTGSLREWDVTGDEGTVKRHAFCTVCGAPVSLTFPYGPGWFIIHAASLDDPSQYQPQWVTYTRSGYAWDAVDPKLTKFERMPPRSDAE
ncbi:GFA family protein [Ramlibacter sp. MMS24-I3-19]|uniref:GFA family protein n=1 Tax=Ramlibacter sp. MMS24-I3-19 TaxID=3416606 RepID=UPI003D09374C